MSHFHNVKIEISGVMYFHLFTFTGSIIAHTLRAEQNYSSCLKDKTISTYTFFRRNYPWGKNEITFF